MLIYLLTQEAQSEAIQHVDWSQAETAWQARTLFGIYFFPHNNVFSDLRLVPASSCIYALLQTMLLL